MENEQLICLINKELPVHLAATHSYAEIQAELSRYINDLIKHDFDRLISYLYRIDVSESKLKSLLNENQQEDAGNIIAALIIDRQQHKLKSRAMFRKTKGDIDEEEKW